MLEGRLACASHLAVSRPLQDLVQNRSKEKRYAFDFAFDKDATSSDVYKHTCADLVTGVLQGMNGTVFAYGATGSGKTYTMASFLRCAVLFVCCF